MPAPRAASSNGVSYVPDDPRRNLRGRLIFVQALKLIPGFWESLRDEVLYRSDFLVAVAKEEIPTDESKQYAQQLFDQWLLRWGIVDEWLMEATRETVQAWATIMVHEGRGAFEAAPLCVLYCPTDDALAPALDKFRPELKQPYPLPLNPLTSDEECVLKRSPMALRLFEAAVQREPASKFRARMLRQFEEQLKAYVTVYEARMTEDQNMKRDAAWTALYQFGMSPKEIEGWEWKRSKKALTYARIQQVVLVFAETIGLTLRQPKRGRKRSAAHDDWPQNDAAKI